LNQDRILSMIGLATRAGAVTSGEFSVDKAIKAGKARLVIIADDASDRTRKGFKDSCSFYGVPLVIYKDKETLGHSMGKQFRASLAILDTGFADSLLKKCRELSDSQVEIIEGGNADA
jgi:ribosomal protein L7Ae-like RNA K-turn-binding protein